jgi:hypothetical protein
VAGRAACVNGQVISWIFSMVWPRVPFRAIATAEVPGGIDFATFALAVAGVELPIR